MRKRRVQLLLVILIGLTAIFLRDHLLCGRVGEGSAPAKRAAAAPFRAAPAGEASGFPNEAKPVAFPFDSVSARFKSTSITNHQSPITNVPIQNPKPKIQNVYGRLPLSFEANQGQTDGRVRFLARGRGYTLFLTGTEAVCAFHARAGDNPRHSRAKPALSLPKGGNPGLVDPRFRGGDAVWLPSMSEKGQNLGPILPSLRAGLFPTLRELEAAVTRALPLTTDHGQRTADKVLRMQLVGANPMAQVAGLEELPGKSNYFIGNDPKKWRTNVPSYTRVKYEGVYPGVDLVYYGNQRQLEYDFVVAPGADPNQIKLSFAGADGMRVDTASGDLVLRVGDDEVRLHKPAVYQPAVAAVSDRRPRGPKVHALECGSLLPLCAPQLAAGFSGGRIGGSIEATPEASFRRGKRQQAAALQSGLRPQMSKLDGAFVLASNSEVAFRVARYDPGRALLIDPVLSYSTYLGGSGDEHGAGIAADATGNAYVAGWTASSDFSTTPGAFQTIFGGGSSIDAFVVRSNNAGSALVYSTCVGGTGADVSYGIAMGATGNAYVGGLS